MKEEKEKKSELKKWQQILLDLALPLAIVAVALGVWDLYNVVFKSADGPLMIRVSLYILASLSFIYAVNNWGDKSPSRYRAAVFVFSAALLVTAITQPFTESARAASYILFALVLAFGLLLNQKRYAFWLIGGALILSVILMTAYSGIDSNIYSRFSYLILAYGFAVVYWFRLSRKEAKAEDKDKVPWRKRNREQK